MIRISDRSKVSSSLVDLVCCGLGAACLLLVSELLTSVASEHKGVGFVVITLEITCLPSAKSVNVPDFDLVLNSALAAKVREGIVRFDQGGGGFDAGTEVSRPVSWTVKSDQRIMTFQSAGSSANGLRMTLCVQERDRNPGIRLGMVFPGLVPQGCSCDIALVTQDNISREWHVEFDGVGCRIELDGAGGQWRVRGSELVRVGVVVE